MNEAPIHLTVLGGYLGAGKTTLLNRVLRSAAGRRIAVVINDFGALNIDAELIEGRSEQQINLTNGCICCGMSDGFDAALERLLDVHPRLDQIVVEASGVADVGMLVRYGHLPGLVPDGVVVVADAERIRQQASDRFVGRTVMRQLRAADLLIVNKMDLLTPHARRDVLDWFAGLDLGAEVITAEYCQVPSELLNAIPVAQGHAGNESDDHHAHYVTWAFTSDVVVSREAAEGFLAALPASVLRAKGIVGTEGESCLLQAVGTRRTLRPWPLRGATRLVAIGVRERFDPAALNRLAGRFLGNGD